MRTVILVSSWCLCDAINKDWNLLYSDKANHFLTYLLLAVIFMDVVEFLTKYLKR